MNGQDMRIRESRLGFVSAFAALAITAALLLPFKLGGDQLNIGLAFPFWLAFGKLGEFFDRRARRAAMSGGKPYNVPEINAWMVGAAMGVFSSAHVLDRPMAAHLPEGPVDLSFWALVGIGAAAYAAAVFVSRCLPGTPQPGA